MALALLNESLLEKFLEFIKLCNNKLRCKFFLAAGSNEIEEKIVNQILEF